MCVRKKFSLKFDKILALGTDKNKNDLKKIRLFNVFCLVWCLLAILVIVESLIENGFISKEVGIESVLMLVSISICRYFFSKKRYIIAYTYYVFQIIALTFYFSNFLNEGEFLEYYYIFAPTICLIFIDNKRIIYTTLIVSYGCFIFPNFYFKHYPLGTLTDLSVSFLYFSIFIMVNYFKSLNVKNEKALQLKTGELEELNDFKSQFFTNVSHEIRTPITLIKGYSNELPELYNQQEAVYEIHQKINNQVQKITEMVNSVLDLAKMKESTIALNFKPTNINELINKLYISFEPLFKQKKVALLLQLKNKKCIVNIDTVFLERALNNIIINALKYTENGQVVISVHCKQKITEIKIKDTGIGISPKDIKRIFERFYQANNDINKAGGSGVGLSFSKEIIELHGGKISVHSALNEGSEFVIQLPVSAKKEIVSTLKLPVNNNTTTEVSQEISFSDITFLIVDDNIEMRQYLKKILQRYKCIEATNGAEALEIFKQEKISFIITDYMMPKMNGYDFISSLKNDNCNIPIIMLTAKADIATKLKVLQLGIDDYLTKPFNKKELLIRIQNSFKNYTNRERYISNSHKINIPSNNFIEELENFIVANMHHQDFSQEDIVAHFNISKSSLYRKIKSKTGLSPSEFVAEVKLQKARSIIENNPDILLKQLIVEVGFKHISYFSNLFEKRFGRKPTKI